jgi:hypothetical protein
LKRTFSLASRDWHNQLTLKKTYNIGGMSGHDLVSGT